MKNLIGKYFPLLPVGMILGGLALFSHSCANTTTPPSGGPKDTIPPVLVKVEPKPGSANVPVHGTQVIFGFDEYVTVKDQNSIVLSPPQKKAPKYKIRGKSLVVYFEEDLLPNTTYTLDITNAIADNNEGNMFPGYTEVFSTGPKIDSMMVTGVVQDCNTLNPIKGATVMLYKDASDSAIFKHRPDAVVKTDSWGFFCLRNIQDTVFRMYAIKDENHDNLYDPDNELVAFQSAPFRPSIRVNDSIPELRKYDMKDTLHCLARKAGYELNMFRGKPSKQMIVNKVRVGERTAYITFMAPNAKIDSIWIKGMNPKRLVTQFNPQKDSLEIWVNDQRRMPDTLHLFVNYLKTDSLMKLAPVTEEVKLAMENKKGASKSSRRNLKHEDTTCVITNTVLPETVEQYGFNMEFKYPLISANFDSLQFRYTNPRQQQFLGKYVVTRDKDNLRLYTVRPSVKLLPGYDYVLKVPARQFMDINGHYNDSTMLKVSLPKDEDLSVLHLSLKNVNGNEYIVDLLNEKKDKILRTYLVDNDGTFDFPYLKEGKYSIRVTEDPNKNGMVDTGDLLTHRQPEKVKFYKIKGKNMIFIPARTELEQEIDLSDLFK